jgi:hypothetical protein
MNRFFSILFITLFYAVSLSAQTATLTLGTEPVCAGQEVLIPVNALNLVNVGAVSLHINFDATALTYLSVENINTQLAGMSYNYTSNPAQISFAWSNLTPANFQQTKFFDIRFRVITENTALSFKTDSNGCEISNGSIPPEVITTSFLNGGVYPGKPVIVSQTHDTTVRTGWNAMFNVISQNTNTYTWKESRDHGIHWTALEDGGKYTGTHSYKLTITQVPASYNFYLYGCTLVQAQCMTESNTVKLTIDSLTGFSEVVPTMFTLKQNQPNPFSFSTTIEYSLPEMGVVKIKIFESFGKQISTLVNALQTKGWHSVDFDSADMPSGLYFYVLEYTAKNIEYRSDYKKMVKMSL